MGALNDVHVKHLGVVTKLLETLKVDTFLDDFFIFDLKFSVSTLIVVPSLEEIKKCGHKLLLRSIPPPGCH